MLALVHGITQQLSKRKEQKKLIAYHDGYDWAAGVLLRNEMTIDEVMNHVSNCDHIYETEHYTHRSFDAGAVRAVNRLIALGIINEKEISA